MSCLPMRRRPPGYIKVTLASLLRLNPCIERCWAPPCDAGSHSCPTACPHPMACRLRIQRGSPRMGCLRPSACPHPTACPHHTACQRRQAPWIWLPLWRFSPRGYAATSFSHTHSIRGVRNVKVKYPSTVATPQPYGMPAPTCGLGAGCLTNAAGRGVRPH